jgi:hypothetical protein
VLGGWVVDRGRLRDQLLNGEIFYSLREVQIVIESWRRHYNRIRPHACARVRVTHCDADGSNLITIHRCSSILPFDRTAL